MNNKNQSFPVSVIMTHKRPHVDEILGIVLLREYGQKIFPGVEKATISFVDAGSKPVNGKTWYEHLQEGYVLVGVGGGCFDEHPSEDIPRAKEHCAATLVAEYLGIEKNPELQQILRYTLNNDTNGGTNPFDLASMITLGNKTWWDTDPQGIFNWAIQPIEWHITKQKKFFSEVKTEFEKYAKIKSIRYKNRDIRVVAIQSDNEDVGAYARSEFGGKAAIVIQQNSKKQIIISTQKRANICFDNVIVEIRKSEAKVKNLTYRGLDLTADGTISLIPEWYYDKNAARILNGSLSAPDVPATKLQLRYVVDMLCSSLSQN